VVVAWVAIGVTIIVGGILPITKGWARQRRIARERAGATITVVHVKRMTSGDPGMRFTNTGQAEATNCSVEVVDTNSGYDCDRIFQNGFTTAELGSHGTVRPITPAAFAVTDLPADAYPVRLRIRWTDGNGEHRRDTTVSY
jgi:hypothetical protein